jgi:V/A-type H+-transporting ATPase subunit C
MATKLATYGYINAKLRTRLSRMLEESELMALLSAGTSTEIVDLLDKTDYRAAATAIAESADIRLAESILFETEVRFISDIAADLHDKPGEFVQTLLLRYEVETLKRALRIWFEGKVKERDTEGESDYLYFGFSRIRVRELINAQTILEIADLLGGTPFGNIVSEAANQDINRGLFGLEIALDNFFYATLLGRINTLPKEDRKIARKLFGIEIDLENLDRIVRYRELYDFPTESLADYLIPSGTVPGSIDFDDTSGEIIKSYAVERYAGLTTVAEEAGRDSNLLLLETLLHEVLSFEVKRVLLGYPFSLGIVLAYFFLKRREIRRIILILNAKAFGLDEERVRSML